VVTPEEWQQARDALLVKKKRATRALDALAAERRRLPVVEFSAGYGFDGPHGSVDLLGLFAGRRQLVVYHFMFEPGDEYVCAGCSAVADSVGPLAHLHARDTSFALTSIAPPAELEAFKARMGWTVPWYSCRDRRFNEDCGTGTGFGLSVFLRDGERVFRSYFTSWPWRRPAALRPQRTRPHAARSPRDLGGLAGRLAADAGLLVAAARRIPGQRPHGGGVIPLPPEVRELFDGVKYAHVATLMRDGSPHSVPMWIRRRGRPTGLPQLADIGQGAHLRRDPRVSISVTDTDRPTSMAQVRGRVGEILEGDAAWEVIDRIAHKYIGAPYPVRTDRVLFLVDAEHAWAQAFG
jgi:PPOX class probable F420-dependent enzyme